ncbi:hypothetical protein C0992_008314, partial [Termitomyces sp. T32_za158]
MDSTATEHLSYPSALEESPAESSTHSERPLLKDRLYVGNLHPSVDEYVYVTSYDLPIEQPPVFSKFGKVTKLDYLFHKSGALKGKPRGYAFVEYASNDEALKALNVAHEKLLRGRKLVVTFAHQAPPEHGGSMHGAKRRSMMEVGRPTTLSLLKTGPGNRHDGTKDKIAMMEAKLRQLENSRPKPAPTLDSSTVSPDSTPTAATAASLHHPSLPPKPPPPLPEACSSQPRAATKPRTPLPSLPLLPPVKFRLQSQTETQSTTSVPTRTSKPKLIGVKIGKPKEKYLVTGRQGVTFPPALQVAHTTSSLTVIAMEQEAGDTYLRRLASFIRANEKNLAEAGFYRRKRASYPSTESTSLYNPLGWFGSENSGQSTTPKPVVLSLDIHRLFYVLMRMEALGLNVGTLDVQVDNPSRPMSYINIFADSDKSDTLSLASFRSSLSAVSNLSLGSGWWRRPEPPSVDSELKYIYSSFTKIPALSVIAPGRKVIAELSHDSSNQNALPLDAFKNLQKLECMDVDPRTLLGWDKLAESLVSLKIKKSGLEDMTDIFVGAVIDDQARREGSASRKRQRRIPHGLAGDPSFFSTRLPESVPEDADAEESAGIDESSEPQAHQDSGSSSPAPPLELPSSKWALLKSLSLSDNSLTFFPSGALPYLTNLSHLDLSSNLLVSVPPGLGVLYNLVSLNLADNMIDSVLGIYLNLGQVLTLNIAHNRLESICGLERLAALERIDLRDNLIEESAEVGR